MSRYAQVYEAWKHDPEGFWAEAARDITWFKLWDKVFDPYAGQSGRWFPGAECNTAYNCLDRHVAVGRGRQKALIYDSPITNSVRSYTYTELTHEVATLAAVLLGLGVEKGDRVIIYMPMIPEAVIGMLACARIGAIHSVVFGGFAAAELATRINDAQPVAILSASCGMEGARIVEYKPLIDRAIEIATHKPRACLIQQRPMAAAPLISGRDHDWAATIADAKERGQEAACVPVAATDPLYILYTSGTTGQPKGIVRDNGGHMVALKWTMRNFYGIEPGEVFWAASDVGWVVGHSYICYAPLLHGCTTILYEGKPVGTPDAGAFWRVVAQHKAAALFTAPTAFRAIKKEDPEGKLIGSYDLSGFRTLFLAGERADPETIKWAETRLKVPVIDHWWQTETGWTIAGNPVGLGQLPVKYGSTGMPMPGFDLHVLNGSGQPVAAGEHGTIGLKLPLPPSCLPTLWNNDDRYRTSYLSTFPGYYSTSDAGYRDSDGYVFVMSRTDDVINVAGHRLSTGQMEEVVARHNDVAECAVLGVHDDLKGQLPVGFLVLNAGVNRDSSAIEQEVIALVREQIGPVAAFKNVMVVKRLPKTRSGKILRGTMRQIADGEPYKMPATIDDPAILGEITDALQGRGMAGAATTAGGATEAAAATAGSATETEAVGGTTEAAAATVTADAVTPEAAVATAVAAAAEADPQSFALADEDVLRGLPPEIDIEEAALAPESMSIAVPPTEVVTFTIEPGGEPQTDKTRYYAVDKKTGQRIYIGRVTSYPPQACRGLALYDTRMKFDRTLEQSRNGLWAHFIWPTVIAESQGLHCVINSWDRAHFTWGFYQLAAHTADENFIVLFRELLALPMARFYFPDLTLHEGRVAKVADDGPVSLEGVVFDAKRKERQIPDFMRYLNPGSDRVDTVEATTCAKLLHWAEHDPEMLAATTRVSIQTMKKKIKGLAGTYGLIGRRAELAIWVSDMYHQGRGVPAEIRKALSLTGLQNQLQALSRIDRTGKFASRCATVRNHVDQLVAEKRFEGMEFGKGPLSLDSDEPLVS